MALIIACHVVFLLKVNFFFLLKLLDSGFFFLSQCIQVHASHEKWLIWQVIFMEPKARHKLFSKKLYFFVILPGWKGFTCMVFF